MPYYQWVGLTIEGEVKKGSQLASSPDTLEKELLSKNIAVLSARVAYAWPWQRWQEADTLNFFNRLHALLGAGIFSAQALDILLKQAKKKGVVEVLDQVHADLCGGVPLSTALEKASCFDPVAVALLRAGEESGALVRALDVLCAYGEFRRRFYQKIRSAALMPALVALFFVVIGGLVVMVMVPKFVLFFQEQNHPVPASTQALFFLNTFLNTYFLPAAVLVGAGVVATRRFLGATEYLDRLLCRIPGFSHYQATKAMAYFFKTLAVLVNGGVPLVPALAMAQQMITGKFMREQMTGVIEAVQRGHLLSDALHNQGTLFDEDVIAMIKVGEESGTVATLLERIAEQYEARMYKMVELFSVLFQPVVMIILGLFIAFFIMAVYVPIFELSNAVAIG